MKEIKLNKPLIILITMLLTFFVLSTIVTNKVMAKSDPNARTVKVGYVDVPMFITKNENDYSGYGVEYLEEICKYVDWNVEYHEATFNDQLELLRNGEIDLVPIAQKTPERELEFAFSSHPMGNSQCVLIVPIDNTDYYFDDFEQFNGKKIAVQKGSINIQFLKKYATFNDFTYEEVVCDTLDEAVERMRLGEVDIVAGSDQMIVSNNVRIVGCFGYEPYYFMLRKDNVNVLKELDYALEVMFSNDSAYVHKLYDKYYSSSVLNSVPTFTREEINLINYNKEHNIAIDIAFITDSQPDAYYDNNGEIIGILPDIMDKIEEMSGLNFDYQFSSGEVSPLEYIKQNPNMLAAGVLITNPAFQKDDVVVSNQVYTGYSGLFVNNKIKDMDIEHSNYRIGIQPIFQAMNLYVKENYPNLTIVNDYHTIEENLNALNNGEIDIVAYDVNMVLHYWGNPRYQNIRIASTAFLEEMQGIVGLNNKENKTYINIINKCRSLISQDEISVIERHHVSNNFYVPTFADIAFRLRTPLLLSFILVFIIIALMIIGVAKSRKNELFIQQKNKQLVEAFNESERANRAKSDFLSTMSHDIRTPLNAILGMSEIGIAYTNDSKKMSECLKKINYSATHLTTLVNDILDISKIESGKMSLKNVEFSVNDSINTIVEMIRNMAYDKKQSLSVHTHNCIQERLIGDELKIGQVCINLLTNAIKYTHVGGHISFDFYEEEITDKPNNVLVKFVISDNGIGMSDDFQNYMYDSFERATDSRVNKIAGSGLGLYICKQFINIMDGTIDCKSKVGEGTTFTICLELEKGERDNHYSLPPMNVLVVDHDDISTNVLSSILSRLGLDCTVFNHTDSVIELINNRSINNYDLVFIEMFCPSNEGLELAKKVKTSTKKHIPIILTDISDMIVYSDYIKNAGINHVMNKPYFYSNVYNKICEVLDLNDINESISDNSEDSIKNMNILVAEDNELNWEILSEILRLNGAICTRAENGQVCLDILNNAKENAYSVVLMDIRMPIMDGLEASRQIRKSSTNWINSIPVIAMTADAFAEDINNCYEAGTDSHLQKPINFNKLIGLLQKVKNHEKLSGGG